MTARNVLLAVFAVASAGSASAQRVAYEGSLGIASGEYIFDRRTVTIGLGSGVAVSSGRVVFRAMIPVWFQNSTALTWSGMGAGSGMSGGGGIGGSPTGGSSNGTVGGSGAGGRMSGGHRLRLPGSTYTDYRAALGDPLVSAGFRFIEGRRTSMAVTGMAKIPISDTADYGTGEWDVGATVSARHRLSARSDLGASLGWWHLGDMPGLDFRDPVSGTVSLSREIGGPWNLVLFGSGSSAAVRGYPAPLAIGAGLTRLTFRGGWGIQAAVGLTQTSPDLSLVSFWRVDL